MSDQHSDPASSGPSRHKEFAQACIIEQLADRDPRRSEFLTLFPDLGSEVIAEVLATLNFGDELKPTQEAADSGPPKPIELESFPGYAVKNRQPIAQGGFGAVYRIYEEKFDREVALKLPLTRYVNDQGVCAFLRREAALSALLQHPNIVPIYDTGTYLDSCPFFTMKLVEGNTLETLLKRRQNPQQDLLQFLTYLQQVCAAIAYAHNAGFINRDLKPSNVMIGKHNELHVLDWGLAARVGESEEAIPARVQTLLLAAQQQDDAGAGTYAFMAPEQAAGGPHALTDKTDVFGLGGILVYILTGKFVYLGSREEQYLMAKDYRIQPAFERLAASGHAPELVQLARDCLAQNPGARPAASDVARRIEDYQKQLHDAKILAEQRRAEVERRNAEVERRNVRIERRNRRLTLVLSVLVLLVFVGAAGAWYYLDQTAREADRLAQKAEAERKTQERETKVRERVSKAEELTKDPQRWPDARTELEGAQGLALEGDSSLLTMIGRKKLYLDLLEELEAAKLQLAQFQDSDIDYPGARQAFAAAFAKLELQIENAEIEKAGQQVAASPLREYLIQALDFWSVAAAEGTKKNPAFKHYLKIAQYADPKPGRRKIREAILQKNVAELQRLVLDPDTLKQPPVTLFLLGRWSHDIGVPKDEAEALIHQAQQRNPSDYWLNVQRGIFSLILKKRFEEGAEEAVGYFRAALAVRPRNGFSYTILAVGLRLQNRKEDAIDALRAALEVDPKSALVRVSLAWVLCDEGQADEALKLARQAIKDSPGLSFAHFTLGAALYRKRQPEKALTALRKAIELAPDYPEPYAIIGVILAEQGNLPEAEKFGRRAVEMPLGKTLYLGKAVALGNLAKILSLRSKHDEAIVLSRQAIDLVPNYAQAHVFHSIILINQGKLKEGRDACREAIRLSPDLYEAHVNLGTSWMRQGQNAEAVKAFRRALLCPGDGVEALASLGAVLAVQGDTKQGLAKCQEAVDKAPNLQLVYLQRGMVYLLRKEHKKAQADLDKCLLMLPTSAEAHTLVGALYLDQGQPEKALGSLKKAIEFNPRLAAAHLFMGMVFFQKQDLKGAIPSLKQAVEISPELGMAQMLLGIALLTDGQIDQAHTAFQRAQNLLPASDLNRPEVNKVFKLTSLLVKLNQTPMMPLTDDLQPKEWLGYADGSRDIKCYAAAVRFYDKAFQHQRDLQATHGYARACNAARAGCGQGYGIEKLTAADRAEFRKSVFDWFKTESRALKKGFNAAPGKMGASVASTIWSWQEEPAFTGLRDAKALGQFSEAEHEIWQSFWDDVSALRRWAAATAKAEKKEK